MTLARSVCPLDCPDRCSLEVRVEDGRAVALEGSELNPVTQGFICAKVRRYPERVYGPERLRHPLRRTGAKGEGRFERISWDEAIDAIARRLDAVRRDHGGEAILPFSYGGSNGLATQGCVDERFFRALGASRLARTVCAAQTGLAARALYGAMASVDLPDVEAARLVVLWGANARHCNVHLLPYLKRARERGGRVALVDPRRTLGDAWVDWHLPVRPGTDAALALSMIAALERDGRIDHAFLAAHANGADRLLARAREWSLERAAHLTGVDAALIGSLAAAYGAADPALIRCGWGVERNRNGEAAVAAILALPAVAGKFGRPGGGFALSTSEAYGVDHDRLAGPGPATRVVNMSRLGRVLLDEAAPRVMALFVYDANPAVTMPDQARVRRGLRRDDLFTVVFDQVMTDTARFADVVLPATTFLEHAEVSTSYGTYGLMLAEPVVPRVGEARPNAEVFATLCRRMGLAADIPEGDALLRAALGAIEGPVEDAGAPDGRLERLRRDGRLRFAFPGPRPVQFATVFPTTGDRKAQLWPEELGTDPYRVAEDALDPRAPLALISPATGDAICSTLAELVAGQAVVELHPEDAASRGLKDGDLVRVHNALGEVVVPLRLSGALRPGVACLPKGTWDRHTRNGCAATALVPDDVSPLSGGACFNDARVEVTRA